MVVVSATFQMLPVWSTQSLRVLLHLASGGWESVYSTLPTLEMGSLAVPSSLSSEAVP